MYYEVWLVKKQSHDHWLECSEPFLHQVISLPLPLGWEEKKQEKELEKRKRREGKTND